MVKIYVRTPVGGAVFRINFSDLVKDLIAKVGEYFKLDPQKIQLFVDQGYKQKIDEGLIILKSKIPNINKYPYIYANYTGEIPKNGSLRNNKNNEEDDSIYKEAEKLDEVKDLKKMFGQNAFGVAHLEYKKRKLPTIDDQPEGSCYKITIAREAMQPFASTAFTEHFASHRLAFLFGRINKKTGNVTVHCLMEPEQINYPDHVELSPDFDITIPNQVAGILGMECVGMAISHKFETDQPFCEYMLRLAAKYQNTFGEYFTTVCVRPNPDDKNTTELRAYQVKDAAMKIDKKQWFVDSDDPSWCKFDRDVHNLYISDAYANKAQVNMLVCAVPKKCSCKSKIPGHKFPSPSSYPTAAALASYLSENSDFPTWLKLFDFNLLIFLLKNKVVPEDDFKIIIDSILKMENLCPRIQLEIEDYLKKNE